MNEKIPRRLTDPIMGIVLNDGKPIPKREKTPEELAWERHLDEKYGRTKKESDQDPDSKTS